MAYDYYGAARRLMVTMRNEGFDEAARALDDAIKAGFTATEILMALRWHIDRFLDANPGCSKALTRAARDLRNRIDQALA